ncbi:MAG: serine hydrolase [Oceanisphaera sp.]|uniref:serine hydrolase n=1 Tax=Oceanisphaera sp. TaxID=1929979 RepID=UPI003C768A1E
MNIETLKTRIDALVADGEGEVSVAYSTAGGKLEIAANRRLRAASVVKLFLLIDAYRRIEDGELDRDSPIEIAKTCHVGGAGVLSTLSPQLRPSLHDLLTLMIVVSDNTASNIVLKKIGFQGVASTLEALGATNTRIERYFCDQQAIREGRDNITTANDMVLALACIAESNNLVSDTSRSEMLSILSRQQLRYKLPAYFPEQRPVRILNKTGELPGIEHDVAILVSPDRCDYLAVLTDGWNENADGQRKVADIGRLVSRYLSTHN